MYPVLPHEPDDMAHDTVFDVAMWNISTSDLAN